MELAEYGEKSGQTAKTCQDFPQSIMADSLKGLGQVYEDHVSGPSFGPEPTLAFWRVFLCYHRDEPIQQDTSQDFARDRQQSDASVV